MSVEDRGIKEDFLGDEDDDEGGRRTPPLVKLGIIGILVIGLGGGAFFLTKQVILPRLNQMGLFERNVKAVKEKLKKKPEKVIKNEGPTSPYSLPGITANISGTLGRRFVTLDLIIEVFGDKATAEMKAKEYLLRDALITYFGGRTIQELTNSQFLITTKDTVQILLNNVLEGEPVDTVYFTKYLIQ